MKRFSKIIALVMVLTMSFGMAISSHGETLTTEEMAEVLYDLDLFSGISTTSFDLDLDGYANREQAAKMLVVALGLDIDEAGVSDFVDVSDWAQPYVALAVSEGITNGISDREFGGQSSITARQLATWFDRYITGSETAWEDNAALDNVNAITRGDLVYATYEALQEVPEGADGSLIEAIVAQDETMLLTAIEAGLIAELPMAVFDDDQPAYIIEVDVDGAQSLTIVMSNILDKASAEDRDNYKLYTGDGMEKDPFESISLTAVNEVTVVFEDSLSGSYIIVMDGVLDINDEVVDDYGNFLVGSAKGIFSIDVTDDDRIVVTFTVDLDEDDAESSSPYEVTDDDGDEVDIDRIRWTDDNEVTIIFEEDLDQGKEYTLTVTGLDAEEGGNINDSDGFTGNETVDSVEVTGSRKIVVTFSDDLDESSAEEVENYALSDGDRNDYNVEDVDLTDDDEVTITFEEYLDAGSYTLTVKNIVDVDGSEIDDEEDFVID